MTAPGGPRRWTRLGSLDGPGEPIVDEAGIVQVAPGAPSVEWWIAGDDRWYVPAREKTVRQSLHHNTPVVETRMRIKGGDVCLRTFAVTVPTATGVRDVVVAEVENTSGVPCGVAFAVRPTGVVGTAPVRRIALEGGVVRADGAPVLVLPRAPAGSLAGGATDEGIVDRVVRGEATAPTFDPVDCALGGAEAVVVVPLAHRNVFRVVLPVPAPGGGTDPEAATFPDALPAADNVARGWRAQVRHLARVRVADPRLQAVCDAAAPWLSATTNHPLAPVGRSAWDATVAPRWRHVAATAGALDRLGLHERSGMLLARAAALVSEDPGGDASWLVEAFAAHLVRTRDARFAGAVAEVCARIVAAVEAGGVPIGPWRRNRVLAAAATVFAEADEPAAAAAALHAVGEATDVGDRAGDELTGGRCAEALLAQELLAAGRGAAGWAVLDRFLDEVASTGVWAGDPGDDAAPHDVGVSAAVVALALDLFAAGAGRQMRCIAHVPDPWTGTALEADRIATPVGGVSYAVRWHGDRPALLWECRPVASDASGADLEVTAPGLDATWRGSGLSGEALLGARVAAAAVPAGGSRITGLQIGPSRSSS